VLRVCVPSAAPSCCTCVCVSRCMPRACRDVCSSCLRIAVIVVVIVVTATCSVAVPQDRVMRGGVELSVDAKSPLSVLDEAAAALFALPHVVDVLASLATSFDVGVFTRCLLHAAVRS
jgi:hypothetical protein